MINMDPPLLDKDIGNEENQTAKATNKHSEDHLNDTGDKTVDVGLAEGVLGDSIKNVVESVKNIESDIHKVTLPDTLVNGSDVCENNSSENIELSGNQKDKIFTDADQLECLGGEIQGNCKTEKAEFNHSSSKPKTQNENINTDNDTSSTLDKVVSGTPQKFGSGKVDSLDLSGDLTVSLAAKFITQQRDKMLVNKSLNIDASKHSELTVCDDDMDVQGKIRSGPSCELDKGNIIEEEYNQDLANAANHVRDIVTENKCMKKNHFDNPYPESNNDIDMSLDGNKELKNSTIISDCHKTLTKLFNIEKNSTEGKDESHSEKQPVSKGLEDNEIKKGYVDINADKDNNKVEMGSGEESHNESTVNLDLEGTISIKKLDSLEHISLNSSHDIVSDMTRDEDDDSLLGSLSLKNVSDPLKGEEMDDPLNDKAFLIEEEKNSSVSIDKSLQALKSDSEVQTNNTNATNVNKEQTNLYSLSPNINDKEQIQISESSSCNEIFTKAEIEVNSSSLKSNDLDDSPLQHDCHHPIAQHNEILSENTDMSFEQLKAPDNINSASGQNSVKDTTLIQESSKISVDKSATMNEKNSATQNALKLTENAKDSGISVLTELENAATNSMPNSIDCIVINEEISKNLVDSPVDAEKAVTQNKPYSVENAATNSMPNSIDCIVINEEISKNLVDSPVDAEKAVTQNKPYSVENLKISKGFLENLENPLFPTNKDEQTNSMNKLKDSSSFIEIEKENITISSKLCNSESSREEVVITEETVENLSSKLVSEDKQLSFESDLKSFNSSEVAEQESSAKSSESISLQTETETVNKKNESISMEDVVITEELKNSLVEKMVANHKNNESGSMDDLVVTGEIRSNNRPSISEMLRAKSEQDDDLAIIGEKTGITRGNRLICIIHGDGLVDKLNEKMVAQCVHCRMDKYVLYIITDKTRDFCVCSQSCFMQFEKSQSTSHQIKKVNIAVIDKEPLPDLSSEVGTIPLCAGKCMPCGMDIKKESNFLSWEMMDFCSILCLERYEKQFERECMFCKASIKGDQLCKFRVRFGRELKEFCSSGCLDAYKPTVKICNYCQKDIWNNSAHSCVARTGDSQNFKDFCSVVCVMKYDDLLNLEDLGRDTCTVCTKTSEIHAKIDFDDRTHLLCSDPCISAFTFVNQIKTEICHTCSKLVDKDKDKPFSITELTEHMKVRYFCSQGCLNHYIKRKRSIVQCDSCGMRKFNFDLIRMDINNEKRLYCSIRCLRSGVNKFKGRLCEVCLNNSSTTLILDASQQLLKVCIFCRGKYLSQHGMVTENRILGHSSTPRAIEQSSTHGITNVASQEVAAVLPVTSNLMSPDVSHRVLVPASAPIQVPPRVSFCRDVSVTSNELQQRSSNSFNDNEALLIPAEINVEVVNRILKHRPPPKALANKSTGCKPIMKSKGQQCSSSYIDAAVQTDILPAIIPIPVPFYIPAPMMMYSAPTPFPLPMPIPIPVPIFIPLPSRTHEEVCAYIEKIANETPNDPVEADLIAMAAMIAEEQENENKTENGVENQNHNNDGAEFRVSGEPKTAVETESVDTSQTVKSLSKGSLNQEPASESSGRDDEHLFTPDEEEETMHKGKRKKSRRSNGKSKKKKKTAQSEKDESKKSMPSLKTEYGLNAWKKWVTEKNVELENLIRSGKKGLKPFKTELLSMSPEEVYASMCFFVKELKKPDGSKYAPDSIYYLCLCVQKHLNENRRVDDIFSDFYYERFSIHVNEVISEHISARGDEAFLTSRIEEEHLWECKQLGAHSPQVLLYTLFYFNTKYLGLKTLESHKTLSYASIIKSWKKVPGGSLEGSNGSQITRLVTLKHITPNRKKEGIDGFPEMVENYENPLRCPVKLYEFYISKCPESVRMRNDVYYSCPERSCVPDSPVWYSVRNVPDEVLQRMLNRTLLVRGVNESLVELEER